MIKGHGGNIYDMAKQLGCAPSEIIDMSSNVNPLGPPAGLTSFLKENIHTITALPEADANDALSAFAVRYNIKSECVLAGNGTTQFIYTLPCALKMKKAVIAGPTYSDYADACSMHHIDYTYAMSEESFDFKPDMREIEKQLNDDADTVFICNPNNPTGVLIPADELKQICNIYPHINFIIDESYLPFVIGGAKESMINCGLSNVIVLNSMSKIFRVPGLRIGFLISTEKTIEKVKQYTLPWNVNTLAQSAISYLMVQDAETDIFLDNTRKFLENERRFFTEKLKPIPDIKLFPSTTSFMLIKLPENYTASRVYNYMSGNRILIRNCSNFKGLSEHFIRISLKTPEINFFLAENLLECIGSEK